MIQAELGRDLEDYLQSLVARGAFPSEDEALRAGLRLIQEREEALAKFDAAIGQGLADIEAGRTHSLNEVRNQLRARSLADLSTKG